MPTISINGEDLYYEEAGSGFPVVFCHEFAADLRSWELQVRHFSRRYRTIRYNFRGYPPSSVPKEAKSYSQEILVSDLHELLRALGIEQAHVVGIATGGNLALNFAIAHPEATKSAIVAGAGAGTSDREEWLKQNRLLADAIAAHGVDAIVRSIEGAPQRQALKSKNPQAWRRFIEQIRELNGPGCESIMSQVLLARKPITALEQEISQLDVPILVMVGDQDGPAFESSVFLQHHARYAGLAVFPFSGHTLNIEEPELFNSFIDRFLAAIDSGCCSPDRKQAIEQ